MITKDMNSYQVNKILEQYIDRNDNNEYIFDYLYSDAFISNNSSDDSLITYKDFLSLIQGNNMKKEKKLTQNSNGILYDLVEDCKKITIILKNYSSSKEFVYEDILLPLNISNKNIEYSISLSNEPLGINDFQIKYNQKVIYNFQIMNDTIIEPNENKSNITIKYI